MGNSTQGRLQGKVALITGSSSGIGATTARLFAQEGASVVLAARSEEKMEQVVNEIKRNGGVAKYIVTDVANAASVESCIQQTIDIYNKLDIAFNNAGASGVYKSLIDITEDEYDNLVDINLKGVFLSMKYQIPAMIAGGGGNILNMTSVLGLVGIPMVAPYVASKHGVVGLTKSAALEFATKNIRVNAIAPGTILTEKIEGILSKDSQTKERMTQSIPMRRLGNMTEIAEAALWLCSDAASFVTGITLPIDGGYIVP